MVTFRDIRLRHISSARFNHVWIREGDRWLLKRVLSYDHKSPNENNR